MEILAIALVAIMILAALVVDVGMAYVGRAELQNALDLAALAGAQELPDMARAEAAALEIAEANRLSPDEVAVTFADNNQTIHGRVIGDRVNINGSNLQILSSPGDVEALPRKGARLVR